MNTLIKFLAAIFLCFIGYSCNKNLPAHIGISIGPVHERWMRDTEFLTKNLQAKGAKVYVKSADNDEAKQREQIMDLIKSHIEVLIITAVNSETCGALVDMAKGKGIKVIAYDRLIRNCDLDYYISFDNVQVGEMQADYLARIKPAGKYALLGGSSKDNNSLLLHLGQMNILQPLVTRKDVEIVLDKNVDNWDTNIAYNIINNFLNESNELDAVVASNDQIAEGVCKALREKGLTGKVLESGQDAETGACKRIMNGEQTMTVYKYVESLANAAANVAVALARGGEIPYSQTTINNGKIMVPAIMLPNVIQVTKENMRMTVIADGFINEKEVFGNSIM